MILSAQGEPGQVQVQVRVQVQVSPLYGEVSLEGLGVGGEEGVDEGEELHDALVLAQVLVPLDHLVSASWQIRLPVFSF